MTMKGFIRGSRMHMIPIVKQECYPPHPPQIESNVCMYNYMYVTKIVYFGGTNPKDRVLKKREEKKRKTPKASPKTGSVPQCSSKKLCPFLGPCPCKWWTYIVDTRNHALRTPDPIKESRTSCLTTSRAFTYRRFTDGSTHVSRIIN